MVFKLQTIATQYDISMNFQKEGDKITIINSFKTHFHSTIKKSDFLELFIRVQNIHMNLLSSDCPIIPWRLESSTNCLCWCISMPSP